MYIVCIKSYYYRKKYSSNYIFIVVGKIRIEGPIYLTNAFARFNRLALDKLKFVDKQVLITSVSSSNNYYLHFIFYIMTLTKSFNISHLEQKENREAILGHPGTFLDHPGVILSHPKVILGSSRGHPEVILDHP